MYTVIGKYSGLSQQNQKFFKIYVVKEAPELEGLEGQLAQGLFCTADYFKSCNVGDNFNEIFYDQNKNVAFSR